MSTEILALDEITASQSAKEVTHNTGLRQLEGRLVRVKSRTTAAQPGSPAAGDTYILPASPTGTNWATFTAKQIAHYYGGSWKPWTPIEGTRVWVNDEDSVWVYNGTDWVLDTRMPMLSKSVAGAVDVTLTEIESRYPAIDMTGAITANINLIVTTTPKLLIAKNSSTGAFTITVKTSAGTGVVVPQNTRALLYCDGTNVVSAGAVVGPASSTDTALAKYSGTSGGVLADSGWLLGATNTLNAQDAVLQRPELKDYSETVASPASSAGTLTLDVTTANVFNVTLTENVTTLTLSNPSPTGKACSITLFLKQDATGGRTFAWPASVKSPGGSLPAVTSAANAQDIYSLATKDAGTTWYVFTGGKGFA